MTVTTDAFFVAHCLGKGLTQGDTHIFHRVVGIDVQVTLGLDIQVNHAVTRNLVQRWMGLATVAILLACESSQLDKLI